MRCFIAAIAAACAVAAFGQQIPFISVTGPNAPKGASILLQDTIRGGIWLGGVTEAAKGLTYFDGSRFISPLKDPFPKVNFTGMAEDGQGGIWLTTDQGLYRAFQGRLKRMQDGAALNGIAQAGRDLFLTTVTRPGADHAELLRIARAASGAWKVDTMISSTPRLHLQADAAGHILYQCPGGYCEFRAADVANWRPGAGLPIVTHEVPQFNRIRFQDGVVTRDRFGCVWLRNGDARSRATEIAFECPGAKPEGQPEKNRDIVGPGFATIAEMDDGSIIIPSYGRLAIGRPGHFRIYTASNGYPGTLNVVVRRDGLWLSNANGLFVMPTRQPMEFWTERDGLDGNTWSVVRSSRKTFAVAGQALRVLNHDRTRWDQLPLNVSISRIFQGTIDTVIARTVTGQLLRVSPEGKVLGHLNERNQTDSDGDLRACADVYSAAGRRDSTFHLLDQLCRSFVKGGKRNICIAS